MKAVNFKLAITKESPRNRDETGGTNKATEHRKRLFAYSFTIMNLETKLYIAFR